MEENTQFEIKKVEKRKDDKVVKAKKVGIKLIDSLLMSYNLLVGILHTVALTETFDFNNFFDNFGLYAVLITTIVTNGKTMDKISEDEYNELKLVENLEFKTVDYKLIKDEEKEKAHKKSIKEYDTLNILFLISIFLLKNIKNDNSSSIDDAVILQVINMVSLLGRRILSDNLYCKHIERNLDTMLKLEEQMNQDKVSSEDNEKVLKK